MTTDTSLFAFLILWALNVPFPPVSVAKSPFLKSGQPSLSLSLDTARKHFPEMTTPGQLSAQLRNRTCEVSGAHSKHQARSLHHPDSVPLPAAFCFNLSAFQVSLKDCSSPTLKLKVSFFSSGFRNHFLIIMHFQTNKPGKITGRWILAP